MKSAKIAGSATPAQNVQTPASCVNKTGGVADWIGVDMTDRTRPQSHALYRFYGDTGQLLYVGITQDPGKRLAQHTATKHWWSSVRGISLDWYSSREDALAAERRAIAVERPLMNVQRPSVQPPAPKKCGHCMTCEDPLPEDPTYCTLYGELHPDEDRLGGICRHCGVEGCLWAMGYEDGSQHGFSVAADFYRNGGRRR